MNDTVVLVLLVSLMGIAVLNVYMMLALRDEYESLRAHQDFLSREMQRMVVDRARQGW